LVQSLGDVNGNAVTKISSPTSGSPSTSSAVSYHFATVLAILVFGSCISAMSTDIYSPSLPDLSRYFSTSNDRVQLTISLNVLMLGVGQLILGPISDRYGRRPIILLSLTAFFILTLLATFSTTIEQLIAVRMLQGFMAAGYAVVALAIYRELFNEQQHIKATAITGTMVAISPAIAPIIGGYVHIHLGWQYNFYIIGAATLLLVILTARLLPESYTPTTTVLKLTTLKKAYWRLISHKAFLTYSAITGVGISIIYLFVTAAPFILIAVLGVPTQYYGYCQLIVVLSYFIGSFFAVRSVNHFSSWQILTAGLSFLAIGCLVMVMFILLNSLSLQAVILSFSLMALGIGPAFAIAFPAAMRSVGDTVAAGMTASMLGAIQMIVAGLITLLLSVFYSDISSVIAYVMIVLIISILLLWLYARKLQQSGDDHQLL